MKLKDRVFHVISNTHWDREWRYPFQKNRQMLVEMIDKVIEILEEYPEYRAFHLDSQSVVLTDYLEIRPDKFETIKQLVQENRLIIGPWYVLPDEFLVGGENLIRNLLLGHRICYEFGGIMKVGYSPFSWGQISQLPQIYKGFGIDVIMFYRGINSLDSPKAEFIWEGADGTKVLSSRFSTMPRYNFYFYIYRPTIYNEFPGDLEYKWSRGGLPYHFADKELSDEDYAILKPNDTYYKENLKTQVEKLINEQVEDFTTPHVIWMEGHDSSGPNAKTIQIIKDIQELFPELDVRHSTLEDYANGLKAEADWDKLPVVKGERRSSQYDLRSGNLYGYTTSARMYLKQMNFEAENWLQFYAEPFNCYAGILGMNIRDNYIDLAWNYLLQNSGHDSIGGCSLDQIHNDMVSRFTQSVIISKGVFDRAIKYIVSNIDFSIFPINKETPNENLYLVLFNPTQYERTEVVEGFIDIPTDTNPGGFTLADETGKISKVQICHVNKKEPVVEQMIDRPMFMKMTRYHCQFEVENIPPNGYKAYQIVPTKLVPKQEDTIAKMFYGRPVLENKFLEVAINSNGTLYIKDKINRKEYDNLAYFYDEGEAGHAWVHKKVKPVYTTLKAKPDISIVDNGRLSATIKISIDFKVPQNRLIDKYPFSAKNTKNKKADIPIELYVTLKKDSPRLDLEIVLTNNAENHRLRLNFPTEIEAKYSCAEGQFDVVERSANRPDTKDWVEQPMYDYPMHNFIDISDGKKGLAFIVQGLKEYEFLNDKKKTFSLTLLRAFNYVIQPSSVQNYSEQKGSQCLGHHKYKISLYPHNSDWEEGKVFEQALRFNQQLRIVQCGYNNGNLPHSLSFFKNKNQDIIVSCFKQAEDNKSEFVLRLYNPTSQKKKTSVEFFEDINKAELITLEENFISQLEIVNDRKIEIKFEPKQIVSIRLRF